MGRTQELGSRNLKSVQLHALFRGTVDSVLAGVSLPHDIVIIEFPGSCLIKGWCAFPEYRALIPIRNAAKRHLISYCETKSIAITG